MATEGVDYAWSARGKRTNPRCAASTPVAPWAGKANELNETFAARLSPSIAITVRSTRRRLAANHSADRCWH